MSKIGNVNLTLQEQANELGFSTVDEAVREGYGVDYRNVRLKSPEEQAHEAWLEEKTQVLSELSYAKLVARNSEEIKAVKHAIKFIEEGGA